MSKKFGVRVVYRKIRYSFAIIRPFVKYRGKCNVEPDRPQMRIWHMRTTYWITKVIDTQSEYIIFIAFSMQQWLHERRWILGLYVYYRSNSKFLVAQPLKISLPFRARKVNHFIHIMPPTNSVLNQTNKGYILSTIVEEHKNICYIRDVSIKNSSVEFVYTFSI
jgi:hypothetical protein